MTEELRKRVVVIGEDDEPIAVLLRDSINDEQGYQAVVVSDGALVLETVRQVHADLLILDIMMPGLNGLEVYDRVRADPDVEQMPVLFDQVAKIAKRGRKRWLGLVFVTQLPQHLPDEVLGLINNFVLHKISDGGVVDRLRKSISGIDKSQWSMLPGLAPGQALVSLTSMARPLLVSVDPTPCKLRYVE